MAARTGFLEYLDYGVGASTTAAVGKVYGGSWDDKANIQYDGTIGGGHITRHGIVTPTGTASFYPTGVGILGAAQRSNYTSPAMSALTFEGGTTSEAFQHASAYINNLTLECSVEQTLKATVDWLAITPDEISVPEWNERDTGSHFEWFGGVCALGESLQMQSFNIKLANNLRAITSLDGGSAGVQRLAEEIVIGNEVVTASFEVMLPPSTANIAQIWADIPAADMTASLAFTNGASETLTIALANLSFESRTLPWELPDATVVFKLEYVSAPNTSGVLTIS